MKSTANSVGVFTTDRDLIVQVWDPTLARFTGIRSEAALGHSLSSLIPDLETRGLIQRFHRVVQQGVVEILAPAFHGYLIRCSPAQPSRHFEYMRQRVTIAPLEEGGKVAGLIVTIEDVTARQDRELDAAEQLRRQPGIDSLIHDLDDESWRVRRTAVDTLSRNAAPEAIGALLRSVRDNHRNFGLLNSALKVLRLCDIDTHAALVDFLQDADADLRMQAALALGGQGDPRAIPHLIRTLRDPNSNVVYHAIEALGRLQAPGASEALVAIAETRDFFLAFPALEALGNIGDSRVARRVVPLLQDEMLREPAAHTLAKIGDESVVGALVGLLNDTAAPTEAIASSLAVLYDRYEHLFGEGRHIADLCARSLSPTGVQNLMDAIGQASAEHMRPLVLILGWSKSLAGARALTLHLGRPGLREDLIEALTRHGSAVTELLIEQLNSDDLEVRQSAIAALGRIRDKRAAPALAAVLDADAELTIPIVAALAAIGDPESAETLFGLISSPDAAVRRAAVSALNLLAVPGMAGRVAGLLEDPRPEVREAGVRIAGYFGYRECIDSMMSRCRDEAEIVRRAAVEHLPFLEDDRVAGVLSHALEKDTPVVRAAAAAALAHVEAAESVPHLMKALEDQDPWVRYFAAKSLGRHRAIRAADKLRQLADTDRFSQVRIAAFEALAGVDEEHAVSVAKTFLTSTDIDLQQVVAVASGQLSQPAALSLLVEALRSPHATVRATAAASLGKRRRTDAVEELRRVAATDNDPSVTEAALFALKKIGGPEGTLALVNLLNDPLRREMATDALAQPGNLDVDGLAQGLRHPSIAVRLSLVSVLERLKRPATTDLLRVALKDEDLSVRVAASGALDRNHRQ